MSEMKGNTLGREIEKWYRAQCEHAGAYYLYFRPTDAQGNAGEIAIAMEAPGVEWQLAATERISSAWTIEQAQKWVWEIMQRLPIMGL